MNKNEYETVVLMEELAETIVEVVITLAQTIKRCSKLLRFGSGDIQMGYTRDNRTRLRTELLDVYLMVKVIEELKIIDPITPADVARHHHANLAKITKMLKIAAEHGGLELERLVAPQPECDCDADMLRDGKYDLRCPVHGAV